MTASQLVGLSPTTHYFRFFLSLKDVFSSRAKNKRGPSL